MHDPQSLKAFAITLCGGYGFVAEIKNPAALHRIKKNLKLDTDNVVEWCKKKC